MNRPSKCDEQKAGTFDAPLRFPYPDIPDDDVDDEEAEEVAEEERARAADVLEGYGVFAQGFINEVLEVSFCHVEALEAAGGWVEDGRCHWDDPAFRGGGTMDAQLHPRPFRFTACRRPGPRALLQTEKEEQERFVHQWLAAQERRVKPAFLASQVRQQFELEHITATESESSVVVAAGESSSETGPEEPESIACGPQKPDNIQWLSIAEFNVDRAKQKLREFIKTWACDPSWLFCVDFMGNDELGGKSSYHFRVNWSIPTRRCTMPRAAVSVYFTFDVSKIKPPTYPVDVYYVFETSRLRHRPGESHFSEKWLKDIVDSKALLMDFIRF